MRKTLLSLTLIFATILLGIAAQPIKVAAVGNSITYGMGIQDREQNSYPAQLQKVLGDQYVVENFGVSATTLMSAGDRPYIKTAQYRASLDFNPDIVLIKLGTNDSKEANAEKIKEHYKSDYQKLIDTYQSLSSRPRIILLLPVGCYKSQGEFFGVNKIYEQSVIPLIKELAFENDLEVIDLYHLFADNLPSYIMPDRLHPSAIGARRMVERIAPVVALPRVLDALAQRVAPSNSKIFNFHGYKGYEWGDGYKIVEPRVQSLGGAQWVIRARFWGHEPQVDMALLERGFHIAYCPVENLYGAPSAVKRYDEFYARMVAAGFAPKVVLEGMSRGGLIVYNWAAENADKVAAIYADAPVMNLSDWPLRKSSEDAKQMMSVYGFKNAQEVLSYKGNPIDKAVKVKNIPIIHVVGMADSLVSVAENTDRFKDSLQKAGGFMTVVRKDGVGHHPHSLKAPATIVDFLLVATAQVSNKCAVGQAGREWRAGAGWLSGADWWAVSQEISAVLQTPCDVLLLGNSIIQGFGDYSRELISRGAQTDILRNDLKAALGDSIRFVSAGISGDRSENILWRLRNGDYQNCKAKHVFITIGVNNLTAGDPPLNVAQGIAEVAAEAAAMFPQAKITVFGTLPYYALDKVKAVHSALAEMSFADNVDYVDPSVWFVDQSGNQRVEFYSVDKLHLSKMGYEMWSKKIAEICSTNHK